MSGSTLIDVEAVSPDDVIDSIASDGEVLARLDELEERARMLQAEQARWLAEAEQRKLFKTGGHASMYGLLRARFGWSDAQCRAGMAVARGGARFEWFLETIADAHLPLAHAEVLAAAALRLDRAGYDDVESDLGYFSNEGGLEYDRFSHDILRWERLCRPDRAAVAAESRHQRRNAKITVDDDGVTLSVSLDKLAGAEMIEILANFVDAEFRTDWDVAAAIHGDDVTPAMLERTDPQRQADAVVTAFQTAAGASVSAGSPQEPGVTILVDERTITDTLVEFGLLPEEACDPFDGDPLLWSQRRCETNTGVVIDPHTATLAALAGHVRFMKVDRLGNPLSITSKQRFFRGSAREAVMSLSDRCICPGCRQRTGASQADHLDEHHLGGETSLSNGAPLCGRHNRFKSRNGYRPRRDSRGHWHLYDRHGNLVT